MNLSIYVILLNHVFADEDPILVIDVDKDCETNPWDEDCQDPPVPPTENPPNKETSDDSK